MVLEKILRSSVAQFEFSCTYLAQGHGVQHNVGLTFLFDVYKSFLFLPRFLRFSVFSIFV